RKRGQKQFFPGHRVSERQLRPWSAIVQIAFGEFLFLMVTMGRPGSEQKKRIREVGGVESIKIPPHPERGARGPQPGLGTSRPLTSRGPEYPLLSAACLLASGPAGSFFPVCRGTQPGKYR